MIQILKLARHRRLADSSRVLISAMLLAMVSVVAIDTFAPSALAQPGPRPNRNRPSESQLLGSQPSEELVFESSTDITLAREKAKSAKQKFDTVKELSRLGSASKKQLRVAELLKQLAVLNLSNLVSPEKKPENARLRAELIFNYRNKELEVIKNLYERGSASELEFLRAKTDRDVAKSRLKAAQSDSDVQRKLHLIAAANSKYAAAEKEYQLANKLFQSGSISQVVMDRVTSNLETAKFELAGAKRSLGARANQVQQ